jgi:hypothetical protein
MEKCRVFCEVQTGFLNVIYTIDGLKGFYTKVVAYSFIGFIFDSKLELVIHIFYCTSPTKLYIRTIGRKENKILRLIYIITLVPK